MDTRIEKVTLSLKDIDLNEGQIEGLPANPRNWTKDELKSLALSLTETPELFEMRCPIVVPHNGRYVVLGGNLRIAAARENKEKEVTCFVFHSTSIEKMKQIVIKDNGAWGKWDYDALANEWDDLHLTDWGVPALDAAEAAKAKAEEGEATEDDFDEEIDAIPVKCQRGDVWELGDHRLMCGDSTDHDALMILVGSDQADCLLTDPPYNVDYVSKTRAINAGHKGGGIHHRDIENDRMDDSNFQDFLADAFSNATSVLKQGGAFYIWHADSQGYNFRMAAHRAGLRVRQVIIWNKNSMVLGRQDYQWKHEPCLYGWTDGAGHYFTDRRDLVTMIEEKDGKKPDFSKMTKAELQDILEKMAEVPTSVIDENKPKRNAEHPTMKPVNLMGRLISNSTRPGEIVLDIFGGSGSTLIAAEQLGRKCFMMELDPHYCDVIIARWEKLTGKTAILEQ